MTTVYSAAADLLDPPLPEGYKRWRDIARPEQLAPPGDWFLWMIKAGRGWGKTRTGAEWLLEQMLAYPGSRWGMIAPKFDDGRDIMVEGDSGIFNITPPSVLQTWNRSLGHFILKNGSRADLFSAEKPESVRGPNLRGVWGDEPATWRYGKKLWENLEFAIRIGDIRVCITGTPKPTPFVKYLLGLADVLTVGTTYDNLGNLSEKFRTKVVARYEGTRLGRQELNAELLEDVEGALWTSAGIEMQRRRAPTTMVKRDGKSWEEIDLARVVVAVDPSVTESEESDECGIVVCGRGRDGQGYVLDDRSRRASPKGWAAAAVAAYYDFGADRIVAETNNGGDLVETVLRAVDENVSYKKVTASRGKRVRAEPVAALYEKELIHHTDVFPELEDQMTTWVPDSGLESPDRMDALVWGFTELFIEGDRPQFLGAA